MRRKSQLFFQSGWSRKHISRALEDAESFQSTLALINLLEMPSREPNLQGKSHEYCKTSSQAYLEAAGSILPAIAKQLSETIVTNRRSEIQTSECRCVKSGVGTRASVARPIGGRSYSSIPTSDKTGEMTSDKSLSAAYLQRLQLWIRGLRQIRHRSITATSNVTS